MMGAPLERPIRVVLFGGRHLEPCALRFSVLLARHPDIELAAVFCEAEGSGWRFRLADLWQRRGVLAPAVLARELAPAAARWLIAPRATRAFRRQARALAGRIATVPDLHAPEVLERVRALEPDLGLIYGAPLLRPELFGIPTHGTLGIHHGRVPAYRGKKTTFWEIYNGEPVAGVTIQRVEAGIDTGQVVRSGEVPIGAKGYGQVERETQALGLELFIEAVLDVRRGSARYTPQPPAPAGTRHYRQPSPGDFLRLWLRIAGRRLGLRRA
jgi:methionyl-tRNA formyltransferase